MCIHIYGVHVQMEQFYCGIVFYSHGGWVVDGFPLKREQWAAMIDQELLPDSVVTLTDEDAPADYLLTQFSQQKRLPDPCTFQRNEEVEAREV